MVRLNCFWVKTPKISRIIDVRKINYTVKPDTFVSEIVFSLYAKKWVLIFFEGYDMIVLRYLVHVKKDESLDNKRTERHRIWQEGVS